MNNYNKKKRKELVEAVGIETDNHIKEYEEALKESKYILELKEREKERKKQEYENKLTQLVTEEKEFKYKIVLKLGKIIERYDLAGGTHRISAKLKRDLKGYISRGIVYWISPPEWRDQSKNNNPAGGNRSNSQNSSTKIGSNVLEKPLTKYEEENIEVFEEKINHDANIEALIDYYSGLTHVEQASIRARTPKGADSNKSLVEASKKNILKIVKALNPVDLPALLADIRLLKQFLETIADYALNEQELRKKYNTMAGK